MLQETPSHFSLDMISVWIHVHQPLLRRFPSIHSHGGKGTPAPRAAFGFFLCLQNDTSWELARHPSFDTAGAERAQRLARALAHAGAERLAGAGSGESWTS